MKLVGVGLMFGLDVPGGPALSVTVTRVGRRDLYLLGGAAQVAAAVRGFETTRKAADNPHRDSPGGVVSRRRWWLHLASVDPPT